MRRYTNPRLPVPLPDKGFGVAASRRGQENDICSHHTRSLGSTYTKNAFVATAYMQTHFQCI